MWVVTVGCCGVRWRWQDLAAVACGGGGSGNSKSSTHLPLYLSASQPLTAALVGLAPRLISSRAKLLGE
jgi:hypothetical protein